MGKSILELFRKEKAENFNTLSGVPVVTKGSTFAEKYDIRDSKDIKLTSPYPLINIAMWALNGIRVKSGDRKQETFFEEELIGLRTLRGIASPAIYGTDIIRLKTGTTQMLDTMKADRGFVTESPDDKKKKSLGLGKKLQETRDGFKKFLGLPQPLNPSAWIKETTNQKGQPYEFPFSKVPVYGTMDSLYEIKGDRAGSVLGKILQQGTGNLSDTGKQVLGAGLAKAKQEFKQFVMGTPGVLNDRRVSVSDVGPDKISLRYSQKENYSGLVSGNGKANEFFDNTVNSLLFEYNWATRINPSFPRISGDNPKGAYLSTTWYSTKFENPVSNDPYKNNLSFIQRYNFLRPYTENKQNSENFGLSNNSKENAKPFNAPATLFETQPYNNSLYFVTGGIQKEQIIVKPGGGNQVSIDINKLRPSYLKFKKKDDATGYSKDWNENNKIFSPVSGSYTNPPPFDQSLSRKRGLDTGYDIINQTGRLLNEELEELDYNGISLEDLDLIPLRFQKINDYTAVYLRAVVTNYQESFTPNWEASQFLGDPFKVYSYQSVERKLTFDVQFYATSQVELVTMWKKIDWVAHLAYPHSFTSVGVTPSLFYFTFGNLFIDKPAILTSLNFSLDDEKSLWEIGGVGGRTKKGNAYEPFDRKFVVAGKALSVKGTPVKYHRQMTKDDITNKGYGYTVNDNGLGIEEENDQSKQIVYLSWGGNERDYVDMSKFKLPMSIKASFELTLLESENNTTKLYNYGEKITSGAPTFAPPPKVEAPSDKNKKAETAKNEEKKKEKPKDKFQKPPERPLVAQDTTKDRNISQRQALSELKAKKNPMTDAKKQEILDAIKGARRTETIGDGRSISYPTGDL